MDQAQHLKELEERAKACTAERIRKEEQLKMLRRQRDEILAKLAAEGIEPETLEVQIAKMRDDLNTRLKEIETLIPPAK